MDFPAVGRALADIGGWSAFLVVVIVATVGLIVRQWWVPGWVYRREVEARERAEAEVTRLTRTVARLTLQLSRERRRRRGDRADA